MIADELTGQADDFIDLHELRTRLRRDPSIRSVAQEARSCRRPAVAMTVVTIYPASALGRCLARMRCTLVFDGRGPRESPSEQRLNNTSNGLENAGDTEPPANDASGRSV